MSTPSDAPELNPEVTPTEIPDKLYFRIGDVARLAGIKPYVLRFWETEFPALGPKKSGTGHRLYRRKDVEMVLEIKQLLYGQRFTIEGARKYLETRAKTEAASASSKPSKRKSAKLAATSSSAPVAASPKGQADLFGDATSAVAAAGTLDLVRKELQDILALLK